MSVSQITLHQCFLPLWENWIRPSASLPVTRVGVLLLLSKANYSVVVWIPSLVFLNISLIQLSPLNLNHQFLPVHWIFSISIQIYLTNKTKFSDVAPATARFLSQKNLLNELSLLVFITSNSLCKLPWNCFSKDYQKSPRQTFSSSYSTYQKHSTQIPSFWNSLLVWLPGCQAHLVSFQSHYLLFLGLSCHILYWAITCQCASEITLDIVSLWILFPLA